jgi:hypothetical protein
MDDVNNLQTLVRIIQSIKEDGALEREDWLLLLPLMIKLVQQLRESIQGRPFLLIALAGVEKVLEEVNEHVDELDNG